MILAARLLDCTQVLDIKPHMTVCDARGAVRKPGQAREIKRGY
jgi:hypothetical protein